MWSRRRQLGSTSTPPHQKSVPGRQTAGHALDYCADRSSLHLAAAAATAAAASILAVGGVGDVAATGEGSVVNIAVTLDLEGLAVARVLDHRAGVAADLERLVGEEAVVVVKVEELVHTGDGALIGRDLVVLFAQILDLVGDLEGAHRAGEEREVLDPLGDLVVADDGAAGGHVAEVLPTDLAHQAAEVLDVHRAGDTLAAQHGVGCELRRHAAVGKNVGEAQLAAVGEHAPDLREHGFLEGGEVDDAVGDDDVDAAILDPKALEVLDVAVLELDVAGCVAKGLGDLVLVLLADSELVLVHVDADNLAGLANELGADEYVATSAAAQVEHGAALEHGRNGAAATVEALADLCGQLVDDGLDVLGGAAAGADLGLEVARGLQVAVVLLDLLADIAHGCSFSKKA